MDLWNLGLIYQIHIDQGGTEEVDVHITMSLTTPGCGMGGYMAQDIRTKVESLGGVRSATVEVTFDPQWTPEMMTDEGRTRLGFPIAEDSTGSQSGQSLSTSWE